MLGSGTAVETARFGYRRANQIICQDSTANNLCGDLGDSTYVYDPYGHLLSDGLKTYICDA